MKSAFIGAALAASLLVSFPAAAEKIDLSTWTCSKFQSSSKDEIGIILAWLNGYYRDDDSPAVIDTEKFVADAKKLGEYCAANPELGLITAADKVLGQ